MRLLGTEKATAELMFSSPPQGRSRRVSAFSNLPEPDFVICKGARECVGVDKSRLKMGGPAIKQVFPISSLRDGESPEALVWLSSGRSAQIVPPYIIWLRGRTNPQQLGLSPATHEQRLRD